MIRRSRVRQERARGGALCRGCFQRRRAGPRSGKGTGPRSAGVLDQLKLQFVTERQLLNALSLQWSCPVLALQSRPDFACVELQPWNLLRSLRVMPVRLVRSTLLLYLAVCEGIEHTSLAAIEQILHCRVVPCLVTDREMDRWLESERARKLPTFWCTRKPQVPRRWPRSSATMPFGWGRRGADRPLRVLWLGAADSRRHEFRSAFQAERDIFGQWLPAGGRNSQPWDKRGN
jgi:hypothetical protein